MTDKAKLYAVKNDEGEWLSLDGTKMGIWYSNNPTLFNDKSYAEAQRIGRRAHVVTLVEEQKVKLPQDVCEELDDWMADNQDGWGCRIGNLICDIETNEPELTNVIDFAGDSEENYFKIIDAYRYGWEDEPEAKWYVQTPKEWWEDKNTPEYVDLYSKGISDGIKCKEYAAKFTRAELKKYHFDSDIFTLVPVEADKEASR
ncbi:hypothetical protein [Lacticaseibacillus sp. N501-2]|uniref:hypothetical protein n=1 Tax=Lacticaseibacillus salsurae TaxID=3367729 RepID=UPI0038B398B5